MYIIRRTGKPQKTDSFKTLIIIKKCKPKFTIDWASKKV